MRIVKERTLLIKYVEPETDAERHEIQKIITEVAAENFDAASLKLAQPGQDVLD